MATVNASGSVWSAVYLDQASSKGDQEGFLIGEVNSEVTTDISDSQISRKTEQITINVYSHHSCVEPFSFYDRKGHVDQVRLLAMLKDNYKNVVGWYQMRRNVPLEPTLRDITLHHQLLKLLRNVSPDTFVLGLFSSNMTWNGSIHSMLHHFYTITNNVYTAIPMSVSNLGETAQTEYRLSASIATQTTNSTYSQIINSFKNKLLHPGGNVEGVQKVHLLNDTIQDRLKNLTGSVGESEEQVQRLTDEVNDLERRAQRQRREQVEAAAAAASANAKKQQQVSSSSLLHSPASSNPMVQTTSTTITQPTAPPAVPLKQAQKVPSSHATGDSSDTDSSLKNMRSKLKVDLEEDMDTTPAVTKPADPFAGLLADMKDSIKKAPSFKSPKRTADGSGDEGPRSDRAQTFPQIYELEGNDTLQQQQRHHQTRSSSLGNDQIQSLNSKNVNSSSDSDQKNSSQNEEMGNEEEDDDATQLTGDFEYTQSGSPTF